MDMRAIEVGASTIREVDITGKPIVAGKVPAWLRPQVLDRIEQVVVATLWLWLAWSAYVAYVHDHNVLAPILPLSESAVLVFVLIRRPTQAISLDFGAWLLAITATAAPLLIKPGFDMFPALAPLGIVLVAVGQCIQLGAKLSLRRSFGIAPANRGIKISGLYRFVRHPMYAGYLFTHLGIMVLMPSPLNLVIYVIGWWAQIRRLQAEEKLLGEDAGYRDYCAHVRWRLVPGLF
jgi:protein-S-isoprenylcysteine O-methyltransferase Ste14